jgi:hypothetical protein
MANKITKRVNHTFVERHFEIRIISYSFYEKFCGAEGEIKFSIKDMNDGTNGTVSIYCDGRYGWNIYANKPNLQILEDVIKKDIKDLV